MFKIIVTCEVYFHIIVSFNAIRGYTTSKMQNYKENTASAFSL